MTSKRDQAPPPPDEHAPSADRAVGRGRALLSALVGVTPETRRASARAMLERHGRDRFGYWLQLVLAMAIATYGLVLGSTGVVIGAMLVSPLMSPLIEIGMGLVVGSPILVSHSVLRTALSVVVVVVCSALLTLALPYHEVTPEIAARTSPTLLDLYVACFCALAAAYTTVRRGSDTVAAAAGTAISIALVPPLCVVGWGLGSHNTRVWRGAALLFTANFCAIVLFSAAVFVILAFDTVDAISLEAGANGTWVDRSASRLRGVFGSKYGPALRLLMPLVLAASVFVPLRTALDEVAWTVKTRAAIQRLLDAQPPTRRAVRSVVSVEQHRVSVRMLVVGNTEVAATLRKDLERDVGALAGVAPTIEVIAVPDAEALRLATQPLTSPTSLPTTPVDLAKVEAEVSDELRAKWPDAAVGALVTWRLVLDRGGRVSLDVVHFGPPLGPAGEALLGGAIGARVREEIAVRDFALTESRVTSAADRGSEWLPSLTSAVDRALASGVGFVCATSPLESLKGRTREHAALVHDEATRALARLPPERSRLDAGEEWSVMFSATRCPDSSAPRDAGRD